MVERMRRGVCEGGAGVGRERGGIRQGVGGHLEEVLEDEGGSDLGGVDAGIPARVLGDERLLPGARIVIEPAPGTRRGLVDEGQPRVLPGQGLGEGQACALS